TWPAGDPERTLGTHLVRPPVAAVSGLPALAQGHLCGRTGRPGAACAGRRDNWRETPWLPYAERSSRVPPLERPAPPPSTGSLIWIWRCGDGRPRARPRTPSIGSPKPSASTFQGTVRYGRTGC